MVRPMLLGALLAILLGVAWAVYAATETCPAVMSLTDCHAAIVQVAFPAQVEAGTVKMTEPNGEKYHFTAVTLRVEKPLGQQVVLPAADITLHYRRGDGGYDVSPCEALSAFSVKLEGDRKLDCFEGTGPGWVKSATGKDAAAAGTVYIDAIFSKVERNISEAWVCIAQPATPAFPTSGW